MADFLDDDDDGQGEGSHAPAEFLQEIELSQESELDFFKSQKSAIIFAVDCHPEMHTTRSFLGPDGKKFKGSYLRRCFSTIGEICKNAVKQGLYDRFGLVLFNCQEKKNKNEHPGIRVELELDELTVKSIRHLMALAEGSEELMRDLKGTDKIVDSNKRSFLQLAIWCCQQMFEGAQNLKDCRKSIFVMSSVSDPFAGLKDSSAVKDMLIQRAKDITEFGIVIEVLPLVNEASVERECPEPAPQVFEETSVLFDLAKTTRMDEEDLEYLPTKLHNRTLSHLPGDVRGDQASRTLSSIKLVLVEGKVEIPIKIFNLVQEAKVKAAKWRSRTTNARLKTITESVCKATGASVMKQELELYTPYGNEEVTFQTEEMEKIKYMDLPTCLRLIGFQPKSTISHRNNLKGSWFLRPEEKKKGQEVGVVFKALWKAMEETGRVAICSMRYRTNSVPRLVALLPQEEEVDGPVRVCPQGFHIVWLPFVNDICALPFIPPAPTPHTKAIEAAEDLIDSLQFADNKFDPMHFYNPAIHKHFAHIGALSLQTAVDEEDIQEKLDDIEPDKEHFSSDRVRELSEALKEQIDPEYDTNIEAKGGKKKEAAPKKEKRKREDDDGQPVDWKVKFLSGELKGAKLNELKDCLSDLGLKVSGTKADLLTRIENYYESQA